MKKKNIRHKGKDKYEKVRGKEIKKNEGTKWRRRRKKH